MPKKKLYKAEIQNIVEDFKLLLPNNVIAKKYKVTPMRITQVIYSNLEKKEILEIKNERSLKKKENRIKKYKRGK